MEHGTRRIRREEYAHIMGQQQQPRTIGVEDDTTGERVARTIDTIMRYYRYVKRARLPQHIDPPAHLPGL